MRSTPIDSPIAWSTFSVLPIRTTSPVSLQTTLMTSSPMSELSMHT